jgi:hypothetical protein
MELHLRNQYRRYDWRLRNIIAEAGDVSLIPELDISTSTKLD